MGRKVTGTILPILLFIISICAFIVFYFLFLRDYLGQRVDPLRDSEDAWISLLDTFVYVGIALSSLLNILWFIVSLASNPEPASARRKWIGFFVLSLVAGVVLPVVFIVLHGTSSGTFNAYIFLYFFLIPFLTFNLATIVSYSEIRYCSGFWKLFGR